jgi:hypothetical protein
MVAVYLIAIVALATTQGLTGMATVLAVFVGGLLSRDFDRNAATIGVAIVRAAAVLVPRHERDASIARWARDIQSASVDGQGIRPLVKALGIVVFGVLTVAVLARYDPRR